MIPVTSNHHKEHSLVTRHIRQILLDLARHEDDLAATEAAAVPYWAPHPPSVVGHRAAAQALRCEADRFVEAS